jgi:hypothetical protein
MRRLMLLFRARLIAIRQPEGAFGEPESPRTADYLMSRRK